MIEQGHRPINLGEAVNLTGNREAFAMYMIDFENKKGTPEKSYTAEENAELYSLQYDEIINGRKHESREISQAEFETEINRINAERTKITTAMRQRQQQAKNASS